MCPYGKMCRGLEIIILNLYSSYMNEFARCPTDGTLGLLTLLIKSGGLAQTRLDDALASVGLTFVKWRTLDALISSAAPISLSKLADHLNCVKSNVTQLADKLEAEGVLRRLDDPADRRSSLLELTKTGRKLHQEGLKAMEKTTMDLFSSTDETERTVLRRLLGQLHQKA